MSIEVTDLADKRDWCDNCGQRGATLHVRVDAARFDLCPVCATDLHDKIARTLTN